MGHESFKAEGLKTMMSECRETTGTVLSIIYGISSLRGAELVRDLDLNDFHRHREKILESAENSTPARILLPLVWYLQ